MSSDSPIPWTPTSEDFDRLWTGDTDSNLDPAIDKVPDMLATLFVQQRNLMRAVWDKELSSGLSIPTGELEWGQVTMNRRVQARIHETFGHLIRELSEAMAHLDGSKSWKDRPRETNVTEYYEEIADSLHFFIELCILSGLDAERLFLAYFNKAATNIDRAKNGY